MSKAPWKNVVGRRYNSAWPRYELTLECSHLIKVYETKSGFVTGGEKRKRVRCHQCYAAANFSD